MLARLFICLCIVFVFAYGTSACTSERDCGYGGKCVSSKCECYSTWTGDNCTLLNLKPAQSSKAFYRSNSSSWGGSVLKGDDGSYHMFMANMENNCGLNSWECNSAISHAISDTPQGPYIQHETLMNPFAHNPTLHYDPIDKLYLIFHIGQGVPTKDRMKCSNGVTNGTCGSKRDLGIYDIEASDLPNVLYSPSLNGPWKIFKGGNGWTFNNPSPFIFPNGSILMFHKIGCSAQGFCRQYAIATAPSWKGPYSESKNITVYGEDAYVWRQPADGSFHMLFQGGNYSPSLPHYTGHWHTAFSSNGIDWEVSAWAPAFTNEISLENGQKVSVVRRERSQVLFNDQGWPAYLFNGVTTGHEDFSYTAVQPIEVPQ